MSSNTSNASCINVRIDASWLFSNGDVVSGQQPSVSAGSGRRASVSDPALNSELRTYFSQLLLGARCQLTPIQRTIVYFCSIAPIGFGNSRCRCACKHQLRACSSQTVRTVTCVIDASSHFWYCWTAICCNALAVKSVSHPDDSESTIQLTTTQSVAICTSSCSGTCCCLGRGS